MDMQALLINGNAISGKKEGKNFKSEKSQDYAQKPQQNCKGGRVRNMFKSGSRNIKFFSYSNELLS
jgi:hypothetical protein